MSDQMAKRFNVTMACFWQAIFLLLAWSSSAFAQLSASHDEKALSANVSVNWVASLLHSRDLDPGRCTPDTPCSNGDCCNGDTGYCGRREEFCNPQVCTSNCDAKAECGEWAETPSQECPLNVCCSYWGNCGFTEEFCDARCQSNCYQPGQTTEKGSDPQSLVIGYFEAWTVAEASCRVKRPSDLPLDSLTHINVAFAYIMPDFWDLYPMDTSPSVYQEIAALKRKAPGLEIWLSVGGWTFNDPGQNRDTFTTLASSPANRKKFIKNAALFLRAFNFDGIDIDWEYPGAPDRGGNPEDGDNFVALLAEMKEYFDTQPEDWGISFAAPTSYWYLRWFKVGEMLKYANWVNLMSYDLHGSWDNDTSYIGPYAFAHTNLTEIDLALDLLWRNGVEGSQVNLGIGFYGRTFQLKNSRCYKPGCEQVGPGQAGPCTQTRGYLSYSEVVAIRDSYDLKSVYDDVSGTKYIAWGKDQWVAFDDKQTLGRKVEFASDRGLGGLMIWAVDLDTPTWDALDALLQPDGLGKFREQNGVRAIEGSDNWYSQSGQCYPGTCTKDKPRCTTPGTVPVGHAIPCDADGKEWRALCCDFREQPDPAHCRWSCGFQGPASACNADKEIQVVESDLYWEEEEGGNGIAWCFTGNAYYCCESEDLGKDACRAEKDICTRIVNGEIADEDVCGDDRHPITWAQAGCKDGYGMPFCCRAGVGSSDCHWKKAEDSGSKGMSSKTCIHSEQCGNSEKSLGSWFKGDGDQCVDTFESNPDLIKRPHMPHRTEYDRALCCDTRALNVHTKNLPVDLEYLFENPGPDTDVQNYTLKVDTSLRGADESQSPNDAAFAWIVLSGEESDLVPLDKRDGSHWEVFDCDPVKHEGRQRARVVCTTAGRRQSNCGTIFQGGVPGTIVELPDHCGAANGRYAVAVSMEPSADQTLPEEVAWHFTAAASSQHDGHGKGSRRRSVRLPTVYELVFDYDFEVVRKRDKGNVLVRIDYSDDPGYWADMVDAPGERSSKKRDLNLLQDEVDRDHAGSWPGYMRHRWRVERRETPLHRRDELHRRWFSAKVKSWMDKMLRIDRKYTLARHTLSMASRVILFDESIECPGPKARFKMYADLNAYAQASAQLGLIGNLQDMNSWDEAHVLFRTTGNIRARLSFDAEASLTFNLGERELFGAQNFGITFRVPGIVTIGPNFRIKTQLSGRAQITLNSWVQYDIAEWDYIQQYPSPKNTIDDGQTTVKEGSASHGKGAFQASYDIGASGEIVGRITPRIEFGVVFDSASVPDVAIALAADNSVTIYGSAKVGSNQAAQACYGVKGLCRVYLEVDAPTIFGVNLASTKDVIRQPFDIVEETCYGG